MKTARTVAGLGALVIVVALVTAATAQEVKEPNILLKLIGPVPSVPLDSSARDDPRNLPTPRLDKPSENFRFNVIVSDPRCLPGEADWIDPAPINSRVHRSPRPR